MIRPRLAPVRVCVCLCVSVCGFLFLFRAAPACAAAFETIPTGARAIGMGSAFVAAADDGLAAYYNPAGLTRVPHRRIDSSYTNLYNLGLINRSYMSYVQPKLGRATAAISWNGLSTTQKVRFVDYSENTFGFSLGYPIYRGLSAGTTLKYYWVNYDKRATGYGFDLGLQFRFMRDYRLGALLRNANHPKLRWATGAIDLLPIEWEIGFAGDVGRQSTVSLQWDRSASSNETSLFKVGAEYWMPDRKSSTRFAFRAGGVHYPINRWLYTGGLSVVLKNFEIAYALQFHFDLSEEHTFSMNFSF